ncbi:peptide deformylase [Saccharopolyspora pogona]|uniref:peptide deformylase n=1 Tax=Saccharopolyspora pogona TaxID=333966 RepID=UPI001686A3D3|nr:peptide deformylase [Saccharopolyspora pogona]
MAFRTVRRFGDPVLRMAAEPITVFDQRLRTIVADLLDTVDAPGHAGVAAPQIGVGVRAFSYRVDGEIGYVLNPEVVELSDEVQDDVEACLSLPGLGFETRRAQHAVVRGVEVDNEPITVSGGGLMARCLQHETDHLDGVVYIQRLDPERRREAYHQVREQDWFWQ